MRILVYFRETNYGGVHTYLFSQVDYLVKKGHEVWASYANEETRNAFKNLGAKTFCNKELVRSINFKKDFYALWKLYKFCKLNHIDCLFSHTSKGGVIARLSGFFAHTPKRVHVIHGFSFHEFSNRLKGYIWRNIERFMAYFATDLISVNNTDKQIAIANKICDPNKIQTVLNGVRIPDDKSLMSGQEKKEFLIKNDFNSEDLIILFVGRFMEQKAPTELIKAFSKVNHIKARLVMIGEGPLKKTCQELVNEIGLDERVNFLGFRKDVDKWYQVCSIYVLSSLWEGLPMTLLEAMSYGVCCIATNIKGSRECIEHNQDGILIQPGNPLALSTEISRLINNNHMQKLYGKAARDKAIQYFSERRMCEETYKIICS